MYSFWEREEWLKDIDYAILGSGIVGLTCAITLRKKYPKAKIVIFESGYLPAGASSKNAGFACFGSPTELLSDLEKMTEEEVYNLVELRINGLEKLKSICGISDIDYQQNGSYELFQTQNKVLYNQTRGKLDSLNKLLFPLFQKNCFLDKKEDISKLGFKNLAGLIFNRFEGQIDTGKMIKKLLGIAQSNEIKILNGIRISGYSKLDNKIKLSTDNQHIFDTKNLLIATNGFAKTILPHLDVEPARAQVLITKPIKNLKLNGTFHMDEGFYYFRNINSRLLFGGGRNLDFEGEKTTQITTSPLIQSQLEHLLKEVIIPEYRFEIDMRWSGVMGVGETKKPIIQEIEPNIYCGVRMGGMGVAIGSIIGEKLANLAEN